MDSAMDSAMLLLNPTEFFSNPKSTTKQRTKGSTRPRDYSSRPPLSPTRPREDEQIYFPHSPTSPTSAADTGFWNKDGPRKPSSRPHAQDLKAMRLPLYDDDEEEGHEEDNDSSIASSSSSIKEEEPEKKETGESDGDLLGLNFLSEELSKIVHVDLGHFRLEPPQASTA